MLHYVQNLVLIHLQTWGGALVNKHGGGALVNMGGALVNMGGALVNMGGGTS